jgi:flagellar motor switch protein FliG
LTGDTVHDLNHVHPYQVAHALKNENPAAIAIVLRELANQHAAKTLEFLPEHVRPRVFLELAEPPRVTPVVQDCILRKTLELALEVEERTEDAESSEQMANLMRSLPRKLRGPMLDELANKDADLADAVKKQLYRFDDIEKLTDRDMQTLLGHCNSDTLVLALQQVEESLLVKVLSNMSKRAKETLQEEMQFKVNAAMDEIEEARRHVANSLAQLCESGDIKLD